MFSPLHIIKVPEGCRRASCAAGLESEVIIFFKLKSIRVDGFFKTGINLSQITSKLDTTERTVRRWFTKLEECGFAYRNDNGIGLISYDRLYTRLGYDMSIKRNRNGKTRVGSFKIYKIDALDVKHIGSAITAEEIRLNQSRQEYMIKMKHLPMPSKQPDTNIGNKCERSISCSGVAKLLGYKSSSSGHKAESLLTKHSLANVTRH